MSWILLCEWLYIMIMDWFEFGLETGSGEEFDAHQSDFLFRIVRIIGELFDGIFYGIAFGVVPIVKEGILMVLLDVVVDVIVDIEFGPRRKDAFHRGGQ